MASNEQVYEEFLSRNKYRMKLSERLYNTIRNRLNYEHSINGYTILKWAELARELETKVDNSDKNYVIDGISDSHIAYREIKRHPCCDKPTPKTITTPRGNSKKIGAYTQHTECAECGKRW
jgi:hypothetical protein